MKVQNMRLGKVALLKELGELAVDQDVVPAACMAQTSVFTLSQFLHFGVKH